jgi:dihydrofolate synthase/folylpolyglutamate synthase
VFRRICGEVGAPLTAVETPAVIERDAYGSTFAMGEDIVRIHLPGDYQVKNAALSYTVLKTLQKLGYGLSDEGILKGLSLARWPARLTWVNNVLVDGAHNPQGAAALVEYINEFFADTPRVLVTAMMQDKDFSACAALYAQAFDNIICTQIDYYRCATAEMMHDAFAAVGRSSQMIPAIPEAIAAAKEQMKDGGIIVIAGSLYLAGDAILAIAPDIGEQL